jgi:hypothetical protein
MKPATEMLEESIRNRAYHLWEASGRPLGRDHEFWERARELIAIEGNLSAGQLPAIPRGGRSAQRKPAKNHSDGPDLTTGQGERQSTPRRRRRKA